MDEDLQKPMMEFVETTMSLISNLHQDISYHEGQITVDTLDVLELLDQKLKSLNDILDILNGAQ